MIFLGRNKMVSNVIFTLCLASVSYAIELSELINNQKKFDYAFCNANSLQFVKSYNNSKDYSEQEIQKIKTVQDQCLGDHTNDFLSRFLSFGSGERIKKLDKNEVQNIYTDLLKNPYFPYDIIETQNCFVRARLISLYLLNRGITPRQVVATGDFDVVAPLSQRRVHWDTHTAIYVDIRIDGKLESIVIDPSLSVRPISIAEWVSIMKVENSKVKLSYSESHLVIGLKNNSKKQKDFLLYQIALSMTRDLHTLFDNFSTFPARFSDEELDREIANFGSYYMRKNPKYISE